MAESLLGGGGTHPRIWVPDGLLMGTGHSEPRRAEPVWPAGVSAPWRAGGLSPRPLRHLLSRHLRVPTPRAGSWQELAFPWPLHPCSGPCSAPSLTSCLFARPWVPKISSCVIFWKFCLLHLNP
uniref:Uncharacterized protein n=1 Tax=Rousettus aegyptiacus TaxID=9407 RepID=A0A7J8FKD8_ROUAE|nr:hypothetical protein HJG63_012018 [Rousettus aegyptiacus]